MALYKAKMQLFVDGRRVRAGQQFESDLKPGTQWEPIDAEAKAACEKAYPAKTKKAPAEKPAKTEAPAKVEAGKSEGDAEK